MYFCPSGKAIDCTVIFYTGYNHYPTTIQSTTSHCTSTAISFNNQHAMTMLSLILYIRKCRMIFRSSVFTLRKTVCCIVISQCGCDPKTIQPTTSSHGAHVAFFPPANEVMWQKWPNWCFPKSFLSTMLGFSSRMYHTSKCTVSLWTRKRLLN